MDVFTIVCNSDQQDQVKAYFRAYFLQPKFGFTRSLDDEGLAFVVSLGLYSPSKNGIRRMCKKDGRYSGRCHNSINQIHVCNTVQQLKVLQEDAGLQGKSLYTEIRGVCRPFLCQSQHAPAVGGDSRYLDELAVRLTEKIMGFRQWLETRSIKQESEDVEMMDAQ